MLEQFFDDNFKGFRDDIRSELNDRIYNAIQDMRQETANDVFFNAETIDEGCVKSDLKKKLEKKKTAAADFAMKQDVYNEDTLKEDTAEYLVDITFPDGHTQKDFRIIGYTPEDTVSRLNNIFGGIQGYAFNNVRLNH